MTDASTRRRTGRRLAMALLAVASYSATLLTTSTLLPRSQAATLASVVVTADAKVRPTPPTPTTAPAPRSGQGPSTTSPLMRSYLGVVAGLGHAPASARLDLYSYATSATGVQSRSRPTARPRPASRGPTRPRSAPGGHHRAADVEATASADVTSAITGDGTYTFVVTTTSATGKTFASREVAAHPPTLVLDTTAPAPSPSGTSAATATETSTGAHLDCRPRPRPDPPLPPAARPPPPPPRQPRDDAATTSTLTFAPSADAYVEADTPAVNYGSGYQLNTQAASSTTPEERAYLKFPVSGLTGTVTWPRSSSGRTRPGRAASRCRRPPRAGPSRDHVGDRPGPGRRGGHREEPRRQHHGLGRRHPRRDGQRRRRPRRRDRPPGPWSSSRAGRRPRTGRSSS